MMEHQATVEEQSQDESQSFTPSPSASVNIASDKMTASKRHAKTTLEEPGLSEASSRSLRLGKFKQTLEPLTDKKDEAEAWIESSRISQERKSESARDPHGEATRNLMFGRAEREWLVNAGGPSALVQDCPDITPKFGDDLNVALPNSNRRLSAKTPAEEAASQLEQRKSCSSAESSSSLAQSAGRMYDAVPSDFTTDMAKGARIGMFSHDQQPLYFSPNTVQSGDEGFKSCRGSQSKDKAREMEMSDKKRESLAERAAFAEERTKRALKLARERLSSTTSTSTSTSTTSSTSSASIASNQPSFPTTTYASHSTPSSPPQSRPSNNISSPVLLGNDNPASFLSNQPGTLPFFEKSNILLLGPSGSGKTLLLRTLAQALDVPFVHIDATPLTMAGYVGEDVESIIQRLLVEADWDVARAQRGIVCIDEIDKLRKSVAGGSAGGGGKDVGGEGVQQALLRMLEGTVVSVADKGGSAAAAASRGSKANLQHHRIVPLQQKGESEEGVGEKGGEQGEDKMGWMNPGPWYNHRTAGRKTGMEKDFKVSLSSSSQSASYNVDTSSILFVLSGAFVGIEDVIRKRLARFDPPPFAPSSSTSSASTLPAPCSNSSASLGNTSADQRVKAHFSDSGSGSDRETFTQSELLSKLEPGDLEQYGLIPEFIGRVPVSVVLNPLSFSDLVRVMTEPKNSLVDQYASLFKLNGIDLHISPGAIEEVVHRAMGTSSSDDEGHDTSLVRAISRCGGTGGGGARSLRRIMEEILLDAFYECYGSSSVKYILVNREMVKHECQVRLFSRGQRFDFEAQVQAEAEDHTNRLEKRHNHFIQHPKTRSTSNNSETKLDSIKLNNINKNAKADTHTSAKNALELDAKRAKLARIKARQVVRARLRRNNRLVDPVIYI
nr:related to atp-dependent clp protease, atp-binding subunit [Melanopsichium pennsylvanicum 4]